MPLRGRDPWLRGEHAARLFRLTERGYLSPCWAHARDALVFLRPVEHRLQIPRVSDPHVAEDPRARAFSPPMGRAAADAVAALPRRYRRVTDDVHAAFREFFEARPAPRGVTPPRIPSFTALKATGFADPDRARQNLRLVLEGRPLLPYPARASAALARMLPVLLDALWQSPDPDEALNQFERFVSAAGPRTAWLELLADQPPLLANLVRLCARGELVTQMPSPSGAAGQPRHPATFAAQKSGREFRAALAPCWPR